MSAQVKYAYLKDQTWLYRRNYPREVAAVLGRQSLKQSLKTSDIKTARVSVSYDPAASSQYDTRSSCSPARILRFL